MHVWAFQLSILDLLLQKWPDFVWVLKGLHSVHFNHSHLKLGLYIYDHALRQEQKWTNH